jgi:hypothetical protein
MVSAAPTATPITAAGSKSNAAVDGSVAKPAIREA